MVFFILFASLSLGALYERIPQLTSKKEISVPAKSLFVLIKWDDVIVHIKKGNIEKVIDPSAKYTAFTANEACTVTCYPSGDATPILSYYIAQMPKNAPRKHYSYYSTQLTSKSSSKLKNYDYNFFYPGSFTVDFSITNTGTVTAISYDEKGKEKKSIYLSSGSGPVSTNNAFLMERDSDDGTITFNGDFTVKRTGDQDIPTIEFLWIMTGTIPEDGKFEKEEFWQKDTVGNKKVPFGDVPEYSVTITNQLTSAKLFCSYMEIPATETVTVKLPSNGVHPIYVTNDRCTTKTKILDAEVGKTYVITDDNLGECAGPPEYKITPTINTNLELYSITYKVNNEQTFHPLTEVITQDQEFTIQFYVSNPILNDCTNVKLGAATEVKKPTTITLSVTDIEAGKCSVQERYYVNMVNNLDKAIYTVQYKASNSKPEEPRKNFPQGGNANLNSNQFFKVTLYITTNIPECPSTTLEILSSGSSDRLSITQANLEEKCQYKAPPVPTEEEKPEKPTEEKPEKPTEVETGGEKPTDDETGGSSLNEETKKFMEELQKLIKSDYEKIETNDTLIEVSNKNVEIIAKSDITVKSTGLSVGKILIDEGTVNVEGPFLGFVEIGKGKIVMKCNAETQTMPFGFISKKGSSKLLSVKELKAEKIDIEIQMEGSPKEDFILGVGSVSDFQPNLISKYESREATANDQITIGGYKNVQFEAFSNSQFPIKNTAVLEVTKENKTNTTPIIIGVVVAVVVIIIIVVVVVIIIKKKKKDNSTSSK